MKAIRLDEIGPPENLKLVDVPIPAIDEDGILIKADCAGLIYADCELRRGIVSFRPDRIRDANYIDFRYHCFPATILIIHVIINN